VEQYRNRRLSDGKARRTVNLELTLLRCLIGYAVDRGHAQDNPAKRVKNLKVGKTEKVIPSAGDYYRLVQAAEHTTVGRQLVVWIWLSALAGLRHTESFFLEWADIDFVAKEIRVRPKEGSPLKDREWRKIEIHAQLLPILVDWKAEWDFFFAKRTMAVQHNWVFYNPRRPAFRCQTFRKAFESACEKAGLVGVTMNSMRHFFMSVALMSGVERRTIAEWAGHANTKMVDEVYSHLKNRFRRSQMAMVNIDSAAEDEAEKSA
jgi:integrase